MDDDPPLFRAHNRSTAASQHESPAEGLCAVSRSLGFSWIVTDIDPTYTLGDMARKRPEIIRQLKEEGVLDLQKDLSLPVFCRIAVISSETAAGYGDFCNQLSENPYGFQFRTWLSRHDAGR